MGAINEQTLAQGFGDEGIAVDGELDAEHQAFGANFADEIEFGGELGEPFAELIAAMPNVGKDSDFERVQDARSLAGSCSARI